MPWGLALRYSVLQSGPSQARVSCTTSRTAQTYARRPNVSQTCTLPCRFWLCACASRRLCSAMPYPFPSRHRRVRPHGHGRCHSGCATLAPCVVRPRRVHVHTRRHILCESLIASFAHTPALQSIFSEACLNSRLTSSGAFDARDFDSRSGRRA